MSGLCWVIQYTIVLLCGLGAVCILMLSINLRASVYMFVRLSTMPACAQSTWDRSPLSVPSCPADWVDDSGMEPLLTVYLWLPF